VYKFFTSISKPSNKKWYATRHSFLNKSFWNTKTMLRSFISDYQCVCGLLSVIFNCKELENFKSKKTHCRYILFYIESYPLLVFRFVQRTLLIQKPTIIWQKVSHKHIDINGVQYVLLKSSMILYLFYLREVFRLQMVWGYSSW
jgi:hypothetical protein